MENTPPIGKPAAVGSPAATVDLADFMLPSAVGGVFDSRTAGYIKIERVFSFVCRSMNQNPGKSSESRSPRLEALSLTN